MRILAFMLSCTLAAPAFAEQTPQGGALDRRVRIADWRDGQVYRLETDLAHVTSVEFAPGETIRSIIAGDTEGFLLEGVPGGGAFAVKPIASGVHTNITVYTDRRSYYFNVVETSGTPHYVVRFRYPDAPMQVRDPVATRAPNYNYAAAGRTEFTPEAVWDDGTFTWLRFPAGAPVPAVFRVGSGGGERTTNVEAPEPGLLRVSGVGPRWVLRLGEEIVCIEARGPSA